MGVHDGLNPAEASAHIFSMVRDGYHEADQYISSDYRAADRIAHRWTDTTKVSPAIALKLLPSLLLILQNKFNPREWIDNSLRMRGDASRPFFLLRYFGGWINAVDLTYLKTVFRQLMEKDDISSGKALALYFDKLLETFANDPDFLKVIFASVARYNDYLGCFSCSSPNRLQLAMKSELMAWKAADPGEILSDHISLARFGVYVCGSCEKMQLHRDVFLNHSSRHLRRGTLIYLNGLLVAVMKQVEHPSILGLRNIRNSLGHYPLLVGGVYSPTNEFLRSTEKNTCTAKDGWSHVNVDHLQLEPLKFLEHHHSAKRAQITAQDILNRRDVLEGSNFKEFAIREYSKNEE